MEVFRYELVIFWAEEDGVFVAEVPELPGCMAHGATPSDAAQNAQRAIELWIDVARESGRPVPEPRGRHLSGT